MYSGYVEPELIRDADLRSDIGYSIAKTFISNVEEGIEERGLGFDDLLYDLGHDKSWIKYTEVGQTLAPHEIAKVIKVTLNRIGNDLDYSW